MIHIGLFEGIGGFSLGAHWSGWETLATCEINPFGQQVLKHYWPDAYHHGDIKTLTYDTINTELSKRYGDKWRNQPLIITGGFPCQPYSLAGKRLGKEDDRHLWPEMLRIIREISPEWVVGENVLGLINWSGGLVFEEVQTDLEAEGYEVQPYVLPACGVNAPHRRDRVWFVAYRITPNPHKHTERSPGESYRPCECRSNNNAESKEWREQTKLDTRCSDVSTTPSNPSCFRCNDGSDNREKRHLQTDKRTTTKDQSKRERRECGIGKVSAIDANTESQQGEWIEFKQCEFSKQEQRQFRGVGGEMGNRNVANPGCSKWENGLHGKEQGWETTKFGDSYTKFGRFSQFPTTEPTIRRGNDGFSPTLVGITLSKHRNESIKAYGNAVIPQLVLQIFKTINQYIEQCQHSQNPIQNLKY